MSKKNKVLVQFLLDKSSSMSGNWNNTIAMIKEYVATLRKDENTSVRVSLNYFSSAGYGYTPMDNVSDLYDGAAIINEYNGLVKGSVQKLRHWTVPPVSPNGMTALYDAIGNTAYDLQKMKLRKGEVVQFVIITDGQENASQTFSHADVQEIIQSFKNREWAVNFLAEGVDVVRQAHSFGVAPQNVVNINMQNRNAATVGARGAALARRTMAYAATASVGATEFSDEDRKLYEKSD